MKTYLRKYLAIILVFCMMLGMVPMSYAVEEGKERLFPDMPISSYWSYDALENAIAQGILKGDSNGMLNPQKAISRAEMATVLNRLFGAEEQANITMFSDVSENEWYYPEMAKAVQMKTFYGSADGKLNPTNGITRQDAFTVIARAIKLEESDDSALLAFADQGNISDYARPYLAAMAKAGYVNGNGGKINPRATITREEVAQVLYNVIGSYLTTENGVYSGEQKGNVIINVPGVTVKNATIKGDLIIGDGVGDGEVTIDNTTVSGRVVVRGGGENSIKIVNKSNVGSVIVSKTSGGGVRVLSADGAKVDIISVDDGSDSVKLEGTFLTVSVDSSAPVVMSNAVVTNLEVNAPQASVSVESGTVANTVVNASAASAELSTGENAKMGTISVPSDATVNIDGTVAEITVSADNSSAQAEAKINLGSTAKVDTIKAESGANTVLNADASAKINNIEAANKNDISINSDSATLKQQLENSVKETTTESAKPEDTKPSGGSSSGGGDSGPVSARVAAGAEFVAAIKNSAYSSITVTEDIVVDEAFIATKPITVASGAKLTLNENSEFKASLTNNGTLVTRGLLTLGAGCTLTNNGDLYQYGIWYIYGKVQNNQNYEYSWNSAQINAFNGSTIAGIGYCKVYTVYDSDYYYADGTTKLSNRNIKLDDTDTIEVEVSSANLNAYAYNAYAYGEKGLKNALDSEREYTGLHLCADSNAVNNEITLPENAILRKDVVIENGVSLTVANQSKLTVAKNLSIEGTLNVPAGSDLTCNGSIGIYSGGLLNNQGTLSGSMPITMYPGSSASGLSGKRVYTNSGDDIYYADGTMDIQTGDINTGGAGVRYSYSGAAYVYGSKGLENALSSSKNYNAIILCYDKDDPQANTVEISKDCAIQKGITVENGVSLVIASNVVTNSSIEVRGNLIVNQGASFTTNDSSLDIFAAAKLQNNGSLQKNGGYLQVYGRLYNAGTMNVKYQKNNTWGRIYLRGEAVNSGTFETDMPLRIDSGCTLENNGLLKQVNAKTNWNVYGTLQNNGTYTYENSPQKIVIYNGASVSGIDKDRLEFHSSGLDWYYADGRNELSNESATVDNQAITVAQPRGVSAYAYNLAAYVYGTNGLHNSLTMGRQYNSIDLWPDEDENNNLIELSVTKQTIPYFGVNRGVTLNLNEGELEINDGDLSGNLCVAEDAKFTVKNGFYTLSGEGRLTNNGTVRLDGAYLDISDRSIFDNKGTIQVTENYDIHVSDSASALEMQNLNVTVGGNWVDYDEEGNPSSELSTPTVTGTTYTPKWYATVHNSVGLAAALQSTQKFDQLTIENYGKMENEVLSLPVALSTVTATDLHVYEGSTLKIGANQTLNVENLYINGGSVVIEENGTLSANRVDLYNGAVLDNQGTLAVSDKVYMSRGTTAKGMDGIKIRKQSNTFTFDSYTSDAEISGYNIEGAAIIEGSAYSYARVYGAAGFQKFLKSKENFDCIWLYEEDDSNMVIPAVTTAKTYEWSELEISAGVTLTIGSGNTLTVGDTMVYGALNVDEGGSFNIGKRYYNVSYSDGRTVRQEDNGYLWIESGATATNSGTLNASGYMYVQAGAALLNKQGAELIQDGDWYIYGTLTNEGTYTQKTIDSVINVYAGATVTGINNENIETSGSQYDYYKADGTYVPANTKAMIDGQEIETGKNKSLSAYVYGTEGFKKCLSMKRTYNQVTLCADEVSANNSVELSAGSYSITNRFYINDGVTLTLADGANLTMQYGYVYGDIVVSSGATMTVKDSYFYLYDDAELTNNGTFMLDVSNMRIHDNSIFRNNGTLQTAGKYSIMVYDYASALNMQGKIVSKKSGQDYYDEYGVFSEGSSDYTTVTGAVISGSDDVQVVGARGFAAAVSAAGKNYTSYYVDKASNSADNGITLPNSMTLSSLNIEAGVTITVPENVSLTVDNLHIYGELVVEKGAFLTVNGYANVYSGKLTNNGTFASEGRLYVNDQSGWNSSSGYYKGALAAFVNNGTFTSNGTIEVRGEDASITNSQNAYFANYSNLYLYSGATLINRASVVTTVSDVGFYNVNGYIYLQNATYDGVTLVSSIDSTDPIDSETIIISSGNYVYSEEDLRAAILAGKTNIRVSESITLTENLTIPQGIYVWFSTLRVPDGISLTVNGRVEGTIRIVGGNATFQTSEWIYCSALEVYSGSVNIEQGEIQVRNLRINQTGQLIIAEGATLIIEDDADITGTVINNGGLSYSPTVEYPEDVDLTWFENVSGTGTKSMSLRARTYSEDDFWAAQEDKNVSYVHYLGDSLTISDKKEIVKLTEITAPVTVTSDGELTLQDCRFHGAVTISGKIVCANNSEVAFNDELTVSSTGTIENNGNTYINNIATIIGTLYQNGCMAIGSNWYMNKGVVEVESFGTLTLDEDATVIIGEDGSFYISKGAYLYQLCDLTLPQKQTGYVISSEGHYIVSGVLTINGRINNYADATFEIQGASVIGTTGYFGNSEGAVLQIQGNGGSLANNGMISNGGTIRIMQGGSLTGTAPSNYNGGTVEDNNPVQAMLPPVPSQIPTDDSLEEAADDSSEETVE